MDPRVKDSEEYGIRRSTRKGRYPPRQVPDRVSCDYYRQHRREGSYQRIRVHSLPFPLLTLVTSKSRPSHIQVTSESHPSHVRVTSKSRPSHIQVTSESQSSHAHNPCTLPCNVRQAFYSGLSSTPASSLLGYHAVIQPPRVATDRPCSCSPALLLQPKAPLRRHQATGLAGMAAQPRCRTTGHSAASPLVHHKWCGVAVHAHGWIQCVYRIQCRQDPVCMHCQSNPLKWILRSASILPCMHLLPRPHSPREAS